MRIIAVDDEQPALRMLEKAIIEALPEAQVTTFINITQLLEYAKENPCDIAFLDIRMREMNGLQLAIELKAILPNINIVFVTGYMEHAIDAFKVDASDYLLKPVTAKDIIKALDHLRNPITLQGNARIWMRTFGHFEMFVDGKPVIFSSAKAKELLAYLVDRQGSTVTKKEMASILWEDAEYTRSKQFELQAIVTKMIKTLAEVEAEYILIRGHSRLAVDTSKFECDYYRFMAWDIQAVNAYKDEYMTNYSWAEFTNGFLSKKSSSIRKKEVIT